MSGTALLETMVSYPPSALLDTSATALMRIFSSILNCSKPNKKTGEITGRFLLFPFFRRISQPSGQG